MKVHNFKFRKVQKVRVKAYQLEQKRLKLLYGQYGLRALESGRVTDKQLEAVRKTVKKVIKKSGILWQLVEANQPVTKKPAEVRMGKGKGGYSHSVACVLVGTVMFELGNITPKLAKEAFLQGAQKLSLFTEVIEFKV